MRDVTDKQVQIGAAILMQHGLNAPEDAIHHAMRAAFTALSGTRQTVEPVAWPRIMYVCEYCQEHNPEICGHDRTDLYVTPDGRWFCDGCLDEAGISHEDCVSPPLLYATSPSDPVGHGSVTDADWRDDPSADERWNAGVDYHATQLCHYLGVDPSQVMWDAATETLDGDVQSVIGNILRMKYGEDWGPNEALFPAPEAGSDKVARFTPMHKSPDMAPSSNGAWVRHSDFTALRDQLAAVRATNTLLREVYDRWVNYCPFDDDSDEDNDLRDRIDATLANTEKEAGQDAPFGWTTDAHGKPRPKTGPCDGGYTFFAALSEAAEGEAHG